MSTALKWTGLQKIIFVGLGVFLLGCLMVVAMVVAVPPRGSIDKDISDEVVISVLLVGMGLAMSAGSGLCAFVRCPQCRVRVLWHAVSQDAHPHGLYGLFTSAKCPFCGYQAATPDGR